MWSRRRVLETLSTLPLMSGVLGARLAAGAAAAAAALMPDAASAAGAAMANTSTGTDTAAEAAAAAASKSGRNYFRELGVRPFINAAGTYTAMTASLMRPEVMDAINYASTQFVMLDELHDRVGARIASLLKSDAAMVTSGAASALTLGTAGVLTGLDKDKIGKLPNLAGMKHEVIIQKSHRFGYDHAVRAAGVTLVEGETRDELVKAISDKTAMMLFFNSNNPVGQIKDAEFAQLGKQHGVPTMNDCAADVPPVDNFWKYTGMGFDLVAFSGGKGIRGPQSAGLLLGRKDLIAAARLNAPPNASIGRGLKVNKEEMLGMMVAIEVFLKADHDRDSREYARRVDVILKSATAVAGVKAEMFTPEIANHVPHLRVFWDASPQRPTPADVVKAMRDGEPSIAIRAENDALMIGVWMMRPGEEQIVAKRLRQVLEQKG
jgi:L-seryl-tRNA(Ser) seleniumtransferase